jgi:lysophospholipase L1-like esterase
VIVAIGDSITYGATRRSLLDHKNTIFGGWVTRLQTKLDEDFPGEYRVINKGIEGDTAQGVLNRLHHDVVTFHPAVVLIAIGTNDICDFLGVAPPSKTAEAYQFVMDKILRELQQGLPEVAVFMVGLTPPVKKYADMSAVGRVLAGYEQDFFETQYPQYNDVLKKLAQTFGYFYIDIPSQWPNDLEACWELLADGVHPNDAGYDKMTEIIYSA